MTTATPLAGSSDPVLEAIDRAPIGERFTPEQETELAQATADIEAGTVQLVRHEDVPAWREETARTITVLRVYRARPR